jgi:endo-1,4-beta-xylanase
VITRRSMIQSATATALTAAIACRPFARSSPLTQPGLKDIRSSNGRLIGAVIDKWQLQDPKILSLVLRNFNLITLGKLKWGFLRPSPLGFDWSESDWMATFCTTNGLAMHGHNLCWNASNPEWLKLTLTPSNATMLLTTHITTVMQRYAGQISSYDVVNEPVATWMGHRDGLYKGPWLDALGESYIDIAFDAAKRADPAALRVLNIAHVEQPGSGSDLARACTLGLVERLLKRGVPVQAIGFESHLSGRSPVTSSPSREHFIAALRQFGLKIILTELDVDDTWIEGDIPSRDRVVAQCYEEYLADLIPQAHPSRIILFSATDQRNWYDALSASARRDQKGHRPGIFDASLAPKLSYTAVANALRAAS